MTISNNNKIITIDENTIIRYCNSKIDKTTFKTGKRFNNFIQVKMISNESNDVNEDYKIYKIEKMGYYEYVNIKICSLFIIYINIVINTCSTRYL